MPKNLLGSLATGQLGGAESWWPVYVFLVTFTASIVITVVVLIALPADYYRERQSVSLGERSDPSLGRRLVRLVTNVVGIGLVILGFFMSIPGIPGQGVLTILVGLMLIDFRGKQRLQRWLVTRPGVLPVINRLRARFGKPPLLADSDTYKGQGSSRTFR